MELVVGSGRANEMRRNHTSNVLDRNQTGPKGTTDCDTKDQKRKKTKRSSRILLCTVVGRGLQQPKEDAHPGVGLRVGRGTGTRTWADGTDTTDRRNGSGVEEGLC